MKNLSIEKMEKLEGGGCDGAAAAAMGIAGGVLFVVAMTNPVTGVIGGLAAAYGGAFSIAGMGCGLDYFFG